MKQMISLRLLPTPEQQQRLLELLHTFNAACGYIAAEAQAAQTSDVFALQTLTIETLLGRFRLCLPLALRAVLAVASASARQPQRALTFRPEAAIALDEQIVAFQGLTHLSVLTLAGRMTMPYCVQRARRTGVATRLGQTSLNYRQGHFWLNVTLETALPESTLGGSPGYAV